MQHKYEFFAVSIGFNQRRRLAEVSAAEWTARTGLPVRIIGEEEMKAYGFTVAEHLKFRLFDLCPEAETILYFDPEWMCLHQWDPAEFAGREEIVGIADRAGEEVIRLEAAKCGVVPEDYLHTGFFIVNRRQHAAQAAAQGMRLEVIKLEEAKRGFVLLPRRWVVERSFAWAARFRRLARDYERLASSLAGLHWLAFACLMLNSLFRQSA